MAQPRYRSKLEVFRDLLAATRRASRKTRIIGLANLNPQTFQKYIEFARGRGLVVENDGRYTLTDRADRALAVLQELMAKSNELDSAVQQLERSTCLGRIAGWSEGEVLRQISRMTWGEMHDEGRSVHASFARSAGVAPAPVGKLVVGNPRLEVLPSLPALGRRRRTPRVKRSSADGPVDPDYRRGIVSP